MLSGKWHNFHRQNYKKHLSCELKLSKRLLLFNFIGSSPAVDRSPPHLPPLFWVEFLLEKLENYMYMLLLKLPARTTIPNCDGRGLKSETNDRGQASTANWGSLWGLWACKERIKKWPVKLEGLGGITPMLIVIKLNWICCPHSPLTLLIGEWFSPC